MSDGDQKQSRREHMGHMIDVATGITFLVVSEVLLLAIALYLLLQGNELSDLLSAILLALFFIVAIIIYRVATAEEREEEKYEAEAHA